MDQVTPDVLGRRCRKCRAPKGERCVRLSGYGLGQPLRRMHRERVRDARLALVKAQQRQVVRWTRTAQSRSAGSGVHG